MKPLVSILIPAYNAEKTIAYTIQSALAQTWRCREIIVVNDGSTDRTLEIVEQFVPQGVRVFSSENRGLSAANNLAFRHAQGDYIQALDADDLLAPDKIERQLGALRPGDSKRILLSSPWAPFYYRTRNAKFVHNSLWEDLSPTEWLIRKMSQNIFMQNATWLVSRELAEAAGPWDERLYYDNDGEYFARVLLQSEGTRFVPGTGIYYRASTRSSISFIGTSNRKKDSLLLAMKLHIQYLLSREDTPRSRAACISYLQTWYPQFYPERPEIAAQLQKMAVELGGHLEEPRLRGKFAWMQSLFGQKVARWAQMTLPIVKADCIRNCDKALFQFELRNSSWAIPSPSKAARRS